MAKTVPLIFLDKKKYPYVKEHFPKARYMNIGGDKFQTLEEAKRKITQRMMKRGLAKPNFEVIR